MPTHPFSSGSASAVPGRDQLAVLAVASSQSAARAFVACRLLAVRPDLATTLGLLLNLADAVVAHWQLSSRIVAPAGVMGQGVCRAGSNGDAHAPERMRFPLLVGRPLQANS
jgi:hypothetical protein